MLTFPSIVKITVTGLRISAVDTTAFLDNCADLIPYAGSGRRIRIKDAAGKYLDGVIGAKGTGESLGGDLLAGWDFTSGWTPGSNTSIVTNTVFKSTSSKASYLLKNIFTTNGLYVGSYSGSSSTSRTSRLAGALTGTYVSNGGSNTYFTANIGSECIIYYNSGAPDETLTVSTLSAKQVTAPSTSGLLIRNLAGAQSFQSQESGFAHNAASYAVEVFDMMRVARPIRYMGSSIHHT